MSYQTRVLPVEEAEVLRPAVRLYQDLTQILRLCLAGPFDAKIAGAGLLREGPRPVGVGWPSGLSCVSRYCAAVEMP